MSDGIRSAWRDEFDQCEADKREEQFSRSSSHYTVSMKDNLLADGHMDGNDERDAYALLTEIGVPFGPDGEPLGIG